MPNYRKKNGRVSRQTELFVGTIFAEKNLFKVYDNVEDSKIPATLMKRSTG